MGRNGNGHREGEISSSSFPRIQFWFLYSASVALSSPFQARISHFGISSFDGIPLTATEFRCPFPVLVTPRPHLSIYSLIFLVLVYWVTTIDRRKLNSGIWNGIEG
ncbi:hypothetical protein FPOAC2_01479 [Fusarium poae]|jgi:hypothetical protein